MKSFDLFDAFNSIDENLVLDAAPGDAVGAKNKAAVQNRFLKRFTIIAACFVLVAACVFTVFSLRGMNVGTGDLTEGTPSKGNKPFWNDWFDGWFGGVTNGTYSNGTENKDGNGDGGMYGSKETGADFYRFESYEDFVLFAKENKIDKEKYESWQWIIDTHTLTEGAFIDVKEVFNLPPLLENSSEEISIGPRDQIHYDVILSNSEKYRAYSVQTTYLPTNRPELYDERINEMGSISFEDLNDELDHLSEEDFVGAFKIEKENYLLVYRKNSNGYWGFELHTKTHIIAFSIFESPEELRKYCGDTVYEIFFCDREVNLNSED